MGPRTGLDDMENETIPAPSVLELRLLRSSTRIHLLHQLHYPGYREINGL
jgi:hypothetical protein